MKTGAIVNANKLPWNIKSYVSWQVDVELIIHNTLN